jgi:hypothetical protein
LVHIFGGAIVATPKRQSPLSRARCNPGDDCVTNSIEGSGSRGRPARDLD